MSLNIKNERTHALVRELAALTGESQTSAVEHAVEHYLAEIRRGDDATQARLDRILQIAARVQAETSPEQRAALLHADADLYDELGLPA